MSQIVDILTLCLNAPFMSDTCQLLRIFYLVRSFRFCLIQCMADLTAVVRVSGTTTGCKFQEVTSYDTCSVTSADTSRSLRCDTARTHGTDTAADTLLTELTVRCLIFYTELPCISTYFCASLQKAIGSGFHFFDRSQFEFFTHLFSSLTVWIYFQRSSFSKNSLVKTDLQPQLFNDTGKSCTHRRIPRQLHSRNAVAVIFIYRLILRYDTQ